MGKSIMKKVKESKLLKVLSNEEYGSFVILALVILVATIIKGNQFLSVRNLLNIVRNNSVVGIISMGMTMVIISGGIDLSVGSLMVFVAVVIISVINATGNIILSIFVGMLLGVVIGAINSFIITKGKVPPFIVTLGFMNICRSVSQYYMNGGGIQANVAEYKTISNEMLFGFLPLPIVYFLLVTVIVWFIANKTRMGRYIYAIGSNEKAAKLSSINVDRVKTFTYCLIGLCVALAAVVESSRMNSINASSSGLQYEMDAISAVIVGGTSMAGGKGSVVGTFCGVLVIGIMNNMMTLIGVQPFLVSAVKGVILIVAVLLQKKETA